MKFPQVKKHLFILFSLFILAVSVILATSCDTETEKSPSLSREIAATSQFTAQSTAMPATQTTETTVQSTDLPTETSMTTTAETTQTTQTAQTTQATQTAKTTQTTQAPPEIFTYTETENIPYTRRTQYSDEYYDDEIFLLQAGSDGSCTYTVTVVYINGEPVSRSTQKSSEIPARDEIVVIGTKISVVTETVTETGTLYYKTERRDDPTLQKGEEKLISEGKNGSVTEVYEIIYYRGEIAEKNLISRNTTPAVNEITAVGTYEEPVPEAENFRMPYLTAGEKVGKYTGRNYSITQYYGNGGHGGMDIGVWYGEAIVAAMSGRVVMAYNEGYFNPATDTSMLWTYGTFVVIEHENGMRTYYAHLKTKFVSVGDTVTAGQVIGESGNTGRVSPAPTASNPLAGTHLHFEIRVYNSKTGKYTRVNPLYYLP